jgi:hypothetical protein
MLKKNMNVMVFEAYLHKANIFRYLDAASVLLHGKSFWTLDFGSSGGKKWRGPPHLKLARF